MTSPEVAPNNGARPPAQAAAKPAPESAPPPKTATDDGGDIINPVEFEASVDSNDDLPTPETIRKLDSSVVLDRHGKSHTFRSLYTGKHTARRVLVIFVRHFYCGSCQNYLRTLSAAITPASLLALPLSTFLCVVGCGDPALIDMYADATACPFPIYADPTARLYAELGMAARTVALGARPGYVRQHLLVTIAQSVGQMLAKLPRGLAHKGGDVQQIGGEFLFEPVAVAAAGAGGGGGTPMSPMSPVAGGGPLIWEGRKDGGKQSGGVRDDGGDEGDKRRVSEASLDGKGEEGSEGEDKIVTWCHRMKNTRDHTEIPVLMEVLGLEGAAAPVEGGKEKWRGR
ncbi:hypothetical protein N658DRAFT_183054 [Parathielavia hyrcaniae]|uniref:Uncharacterized protein n=1 Tax=Parathielavia hyrcaniae TaxID=113614 RepID=A0AAN6T5C1_9PEZI|nr:hypothetical protein N658DRAFT_183054 [Parathielavia hyrcaniae]